MLVGRVKLSTEDGHDSLSANNILVLPAGGDGLDLSVEVDGGLSVEVSGSDEGGAGSGEAEEGERYRDGHVDTNLSDINLVLEFASGSSRAGEDCSSISVGVGVDQLNGLFQGINIDTNQNGTEDLLSVAIHIGGDIGDDSWGKEVAVGELGDGDISPVQYNGGSLEFRALNEAFDASFASFVDKRSNISRGTHSTGESEFASTLSNLRDPVLSLSHKHGIVQPERLSQWESR